MPGLFAIISPEAIEETVSNDAIQALHSEPWFVESRYEELALPILFGRVSNGILNTRQPRISEDGRYVAMLEGEILNTAELLVAQGISVEGKDDLDLILTMNACGSPASWLGRCQGSFTLVLWDIQARTLTIANDRFGLRPHYYAWDGHRFVLGPEVKFVLKFPWVSKSLNLTSVTEYFAFQCILGDRTFFRDIYTLPYASILTLDMDTGKLRTERYWDFDQIPYRPEITSEEAVEQASHLFLEAIRKQMASRHRYGVYLSAGLDSRMILGAIPRDRYPIHAFTFGFENSRDQVYAAEMCRRLGVAHHPIYFTSGHWLEQIAEKHMQLTEGFHCLFHAHGFHMSPIARDHIDINLSGYAGGATLGGFVLTRPYFMREGEDWSSLARALYYQLLHVFGYGFTTDLERRQLFTDTVWTDPERLSARDAMQASLEPFRSFRFENVIDYHYLANRGRKMLRQYLVFARPYHEDREPFCDYDLFDFVYSLPAHYRQGRSFQIEMLDRISPRLATVPVTEDDQLPNRSMMRRRIRAAELDVKRWMYYLSGRRLFRPLRRSYQDYAGWLAQDIGEWVESILLDSRTLDRGIFSPPFVHSVLEQHLSGGEDCTWKIGLMLSFEMMMRQLCDQDDTSA